MACGILPFWRIGYPTAPAFWQPRHGLHSHLTSCPRTQRSYTAMPSPVPYSAPLPDKVCGSYGYRDANGDVFNYAATTTHLYMQPTGQTDFADVSWPERKPYTTPDDGNWDMTSFGNRIIATKLHRPDPEHAGRCRHGLFSEILSPDAPRARHCAVIP